MVPRGALAGRRESSSKPRPRNKRKAQPHLRRSPVEASALAPGMTALQAASITRETYQNFRSDYGEFEAFAQKSRLRLDTVMRVVQVSARSLMQLYLAGEGLAKAQRVLAAILFMNPIVGRGARGKLPQASQALEGFRRLVPPRARQPFPLVVIAMLAHSLMEGGEVDAAHGMLLSFELYLRPGELSGIRAIDFVMRRTQRAARRRRVETSFADVVLNPQEIGVPSKTLEYDNCVSLDLPRHEPLATAIAWRLDLRLGPGWYARETDRVRRGGTAVGLMPMDSRRLLMKVQAAVQRLGVNAGEVHMHRLRHSGASHDYARRIRSIEDIRRRGRWKAFNSVRRYEKGARVQQLLASLPSAVHAHAVACEESLGDLLAARCLPLSPPWLPASSWSSSRVAKGSPKS